MTKQELEDRKRREEEARQAMIEIGQVPDTAARDDKPAPTGKSDVKFPVDLEEQAEEARDRYQVAHEQAAKEVLNMEKIRQALANARARKEDS